MGDLNELVERLRTHADDCERLSMPEGRPALSREAAAALTSLIAERDGLREALKPFAACADHYVQPGYNMLEPVISHTTWNSRGETRAFLTRGHFAIARTALSLDTNKGDGV